MDSLERVRIILGISSNNEEKLKLLSVYMEKAREDIEAVCRDNFLDPDTGEDIFPKQLNSVLEDLVLARYRKRQAEGYSSQNLEMRVPHFRSISRIVLNSVCILLQG